MSEADRGHMQAALGLAARGLGLVWPNPAVGCVVVRDGTVVGRGWTQPGGRPHAETEALRRTGPAAQGATAYVTLEPCRHHGRTPPCADALVAAGVRRVVVALGDPDPRVDGRGIARLGEAGIAVEVGLCAAEAEALNAGFLSRIRRGRPWVTLKLATTLDGRIATAGGESRWITGPAARAWGHRLRATHDAVAIGIGTALADDPALTCRLPGLEDRSPVRVVFDSHARLPPTSRLAASAASVPTWLVTLPASANPARRLAETGVTVISVEGDGRPDPLGALRALGEQGLTRLLVEGGAGLATALLAADLVDRIEWFRAAALIGGDGLPAVGPLGVSGIPDLRRFRRVAVRPVDGDDVWETYERAGQG